MPSNVDSASEVTLSSNPSLNQLRSQLSGKPMLKFVRCRRSDTGESGLDPSLLSPPLSVDTLDTPPFKPMDSDQTSLSMKNRRHRRARRHRDVMDRASTGDAEERPTKPHHTRRRLTSTSVPDLRFDAARQRIPSSAGQLLMRQQLQAMHRANRRDSIARSVECKRRASLPQKPRRWTMPSKAASTRVLSESPTPIATTAIVPTTGRQEPSPASAGPLHTSQPSPPSSPQPENDHPPTKPTETPAMITLRRATKKAPSSLIRRRTSLRPHALTSFPPPKFNRTTSTYLSSIFGLPPPHLPPSTTTTTTTTDPLLHTSVRQSSWSTDHDRSCPSSSADHLRKPSITPTHVHLTPNTLAAPAFTQVEFLPLGHHPPIHTPADPQELVRAVERARRCSTTIVSGSSVHEIIWDENVTSSSEGSSPRGERSRKGSKGGRGRKEEELVERLEGQLWRDHELGVGSRGSGLGGDGEPRSRVRRLTHWNLDLNLAHLLPNGESGTTTTTRQQGDANLHLEPRLNHHDFDTTTTTTTTMMMPSGNAALSATLQDEDEAQLSPSRERVGFFPPPLEGSAGNRLPSSLSSRKDISTPRNGAGTGTGSKRVSIEDPATTSTLVAVLRTDHDQGKTRPHDSPRARKPSLGNSIGRSAHVRRRSTTPAAEMHVANHGRFGAWASRRASRAGKQIPRNEGDERMPLLGSDAGVDDAGATGVGDGDLEGFDVTTRGRSSAEDLSHARKMSVQDFVCKIERLNQGGRGQGMGGVVAGPGGLVRRDRPWVVGCSGKASVRERERERGRDGLSSEVGEEYFEGRSVSMDTDMDMDMDMDIQDERDGEGEESAVFI